MLGALDALETLVVSGGVDPIVVSSRAIVEERLGPLTALCARHGVATTRLHIGFDNILQAPPRKDTGAA